MKREQSSKRDGRCVVAVPSVFSTTFHILRTDRVVCLVYSREMLETRSNSMQRRSSLALFVFLGGLWFGVAAHAQKAEKSVREQLEFGVEMAQRGLWSEALFRFKRVERVAPENSSVVNNLAVAHEALGLFEEALIYYRRAIELDPNNRALKRNYSRFVEFYQGFKRPEAGEEEAAAPAGEEPAAASTGESGD
ncbi:MAG: tetratricopeptide repeat protein [Acidobacteriota bacterium]